LHILKKLGYNACFVAITFALPIGGCFTMHMKEVTMRVIISGMPSNNI
jgi:hypothetical protein